MNKKNKGRVCRRLFLLLGLSIATAIGGFGVYGHATDSHVNAEIAGCRNSALTRLIRTYDNQGKPVKAEGVKASAYDGFLFRLKEDAPAVYHSKNALRASGGHVTCVDGEHLYRADRLQDIDRFADEKYISRIEPDYRVKAFSEHASQSGTPGAGKSETSENTPKPDDPDYNDGQQWNLPMMKVEGAWEKEVYGQPQFERSETVTIGVIDSGLYGSGGSQPEHVDINYSHVKKGTNLVTSDDGTPDTMGHGTFVAGMIFASTNNGRGIAGIMPEVDVMPIKVFGTSRSTTTSAVIQGIHEAVNRNVDVINLSLGSAYYSAEMKEICDTAEQNGILTIAAAGNDGTRANNYPAAYDSVVGVASVDEDGSTSYFSQYGDSVTVAAPGGKVHSLKNTRSETEKENYSTGSGTSYASPEVAALAGMVKSMAPHTDLSEFKTLLKETSQDKGDPGFDDYYGWGIVDFSAMAEKVMESVDLPLYELTFQPSDEEGEALSGTETVLTAAEDVHWKENEEAGIKAGSWKKGTVISPEDNGTYQLHKGKYHYVVKKDGYWTEEGTISTYMAHQTRKLTMQKTYSLAVRMLDADGEKLDDISLTMTRNSDHLNVTFGQQEDGSYVSEVPAGTYQYQAASEGHISRRGTVTIKKNTGAQTLDLILYERDQLCRVTFRGYDKEKGLEDGLLDGTQYTLLSTEGEEILPEEDGTYYIVRGKTYRCTAIRPGYEDAVLRGTAPDAAQQSVSIAMTSVEYTLSIQAADEEEGELPQAEIVVRDQSGKVQEPFKTNDSKYNLPRGTYEYTASCSGYGTRRGSITVDPESGDRTLRITMERVRYPVTFSVKDTEGTALDQAVINVYRSNGTLCRPDQNGTLMLAEGSYTYSAARSGYQTVSGKCRIKQRKEQQIEVTMTLQSADPSDEPYAGGSGTKEDPYLISTEQQLRALADQTRLVYAGKEKAETNRTAYFGEGEYYRMTNDITLTESWNPIGQFEHSGNYCIFSGNFDGGGHTVYGIRLVHHYNGCGFFGYVRGASIRNLTVEGSISGSQRVGGIVGCIWYDSDPSVVENCSNKAAISGSQYVGGIAGNVYLNASGSSKVRGMIKGCSNDGTVTGSAKATEVGGIAGSAKAIRIMNCCNRANVTGLYDVGGIIGTSGTKEENIYLSNVYHSADAVYTAKDKENGTKYQKYYGYVGGIAGYSAGHFSHTYYKKPGDNYKAAVGVNEGTEQEYVKGYSAAKMSGQQSFVDELNIENEQDNGAFVLTEGYPALSWEKGTPAQRYADAPVILKQPESSAEGYKSGEKPDPFTCQVSPVTDGGVLTYQWYVNEINSIHQADPIEGASGTVDSSGTVTCVPDTNSAGRAYYFVVIRNTVSTGAESLSARTISDIVSVTVTGKETVQKPEIRTIGIGRQGGTEPLQQEMALYREETGAEIHVTASPPDGGTLSCQWYRSKHADTKGNAISGGGFDENGSAICPIDTSVPGTWYYYAKVTHQAENGDRSAAVRSGRVTVTIREQSKQEEEEQRKEEERKKNEAAAGKVIEQIKQILAKSEPGVDDIHAVRSAYDVLSEEQKELVTNYKDFAALEQKVLEAEKERQRKEEERKKNEAAAGKVIEQIKQILAKSEPGVDDIHAVRSAYDALSEEQKERVTGYNDFEELEARTIQAAAMVQIKSIAARADWDRVVLNWTLFPGSDDAEQTRADQTGNAANAYQVLRSEKKNGTYRVAGIAVSQKWTDRSVKTGTTYYYKVRPVRTYSCHEKTHTLQGKVSSTVTAKPSLRKVTGLRAKAVKQFKGKKANTKARKKKRIVRLAWNPVSGASGYKVYRKSGKNGTWRYVKTLHVETKAGKKTVKWNDKNRKRGKTYWYQVKAIRKADKKTFSGPKSKGKKIKIKK